ncbi:HlyD family type I secretion periplasmic adaptor subunit [Oceanibaculum indicum]|uniref:Membrane fusion protein (MFP) family protein n=1 Tax=Oceanibaculum indicum P24 TaxID=1207063 RepID=K2JC04_9PROT|nr:HlyD family type I secretion periplasmic adaptor subunit [Oceanibaculum indicum]EKE68129.1 HlyD family secretion protein [Oceanibaculum indicum P24]
MAKTPSLPGNALPGNALTVKGASEAQGFPELQTSARGPILAGMIIIGVMFGGFGLWSAVAQLDSAVVAGGVISVEGKRKAIQHLEGGIVADILVSDGDKVEKDQVLLRLDPIRPQANFQIVRGQLDAALALEARLTAERTGAEGIDFPQGLLDRLVEPEVADAIQGQITLFEARRDAIKGQVEVLESRILQLREEIKGLTEERAANVRQMAILKDEINGIQDLVSRGLVARPRLLALQRAVADLEGENARLSGNIARQQQAIGETRLQVISIQNQFREEVARQHRETEAQIFDLRERFTAARDIVDRIELRAPHSGYVVGLRAHTIGGVIRPGDTIMEIVPSGEELVLEAQVRPEDIDNVTVGQEADVMLTAFKMRNTPNVPGEVVTVSADRLVDERSGAPYYLAKILIDKDALANLAHVELQPGMPAEVFIKVGPRTPLNYMIEPLTDSMRRAFREP